MRRCKQLVEALVGVQLGLDDGLSALPPGVQRRVLKTPRAGAVVGFDPLLKLDLRPRFVRDKNCLKLVIFAGDHSKEGPNIVRTTVNRTKYC